MPLAFDQENGAQLLRGLLHLCVVQLLVVVVLQLIAVSLSQWEMYQQELCGRRRQRLRGLVGRVPNVGAFVCCEVVLLEQLHFIKRPRVGLVFQPKGPKLLPERLRFIVRLLLLSGWQ